MSIDILLIWAEFATCTVFIVMAGIKLSLYGDMIAAKTGISGSLVGIVLLATVTSLPELITGFSSLVLINAPDIAVGSIFGSCVFNLTILVVLDFLFYGQSIYHHASKHHMITARFSFILIAFAGLNVLFADKSDIFNIAHIGIYTPIILLLYVISMRAVFAHEPIQEPKSTKEIVSHHSDISLRKAATYFMFAAIVIVIAGTFLPYVSVALAEAMGWNESFMGTLFVAAVTSLPELTVTIAALRLGAIDMAIANLLGSNLFNIAILAFDDLIFLQGSLFSYSSHIHAVSALSATIMTGIFMVGLTSRLRTQPFSKTTWISPALLILFLLNTYVLYIYST